MRRNRTKKQRTRYDQNSKTIPRPRPRTTVSYTNPSIRQQSLIISSATPNEPVHHPRTLFNLQPNQSPLYPHNPPINILTIHQSFQGINPEHHLMNPNLIKEMYSKMLKRISSSHQISPTRTDSSLLIHPIRKRNQREHLLDFHLQFIHQLEMVLRRI